MAEIKLNDSFEAEVQAFRATGEDLDSVNVGEISTSGLSLPTVNAYQERLYRIRVLVGYFMLLTKKDAKDMDELALRLKTADNESAGAQTGSTAVNGSTSANTAKGIVGDISKNARNAAANAVKQTVSGGGNGTSGGGNGGGGTRGSASKSHSSARGHSAGTHGGGSGRRF